MTYSSWERLRRSTPSSTRSGKRCSHHQQEKHHLERPSLSSAEESPTKEVMLTSPWATSTSTASLMKWISSSAIQPSNNNRNNIHKRERRGWTTNRPNGTSTVLPTCREAAKGGAHQARHQLCNKRARKIISTTDHQRPEETTTSGHVSRGTKELQVHHSTNHQVERPGSTTTWLEHLCGQRRGRLPSDQEKHRRFRHRIPWYVHPLLRHRYGHAGSALHQELSQRSLENWKQSASTSASTLTAQPANQWQHDKACQNEESTSKSSSCSSKASFKEAWYHYAESLARTTRQTSSQNKRNSRSAEMAHLQHGHLLALNQATACITSIASKYVKHTSASNIAELASHGTNISSHAEHLHALDLL